MLWKRDEWSYSYHNDGEIFGTWVKCMSDQKEMGLCKVQSWRKIHTDFLVDSEVLKWNGINTNTIQSYSEEKGMALDFEFHYMGRLYYVISARIYRARQLRTSLGIGESFRVPRRRGRPFPSACRDDSAPHAEVLIKEVKSHCMGRACWAVLFASVEEPMVAPLNNLQVPAANCCNSTRETEEVRS